MPTERMLALIQRVKYSDIVATFLVTIGAVVISLSPIFVKISSVGPTMAGFYRTLIGGIIISAIAIINKEKLFKGYRKTALCSVAALAFALGLSFWHRSIISIGPGPSTILANFQVFFLSGIGIVFLREKINLRLAISIPLSIIGISILVGIDRLGADIDYQTGVIYGLSAAFCYALYVIVLKKIQTDETLIAQFSNFAVVSICCAFIMGLEGYFQGESFGIPDINSLVCMVSYGVLCQATGWILISIGLPNMAASRVGIILLLQPTGAFVWDVIIFNRITTGIEYFGASIALAAIYFGGVKK